MTDGKRTIIGPGGTMLNAGDKVPCELAMARASNETRRIYDSWQALRGADEALPSLSAWDLSQSVPDLQPSLLVVEVLQEARDYRYLRLGARAAEFRGYNPTGKTVRDIYSGDALTFVLENYDLAIAQNSGIVDFSIDVVPDDRFIELETLLLPLSDDGRQPTHVLVYGHYILK